MRDRENRPRRDRAVSFAIAAAVSAAALWKAARPGAQETTPFSVALPAFFALTIALAPAPSNRPGLLAKWILLSLMTAAAVLEAPLICAPAAIFLFHYFSTLYPEDSLIPSPETAPSDPPGLSEALQGVADPARELA